MSRRERPALGVHVGERRGSGDVSERHGRDSSDSPDSAPAARLIGHVKIASFLTRLHRCERIAEGTARPR